VAPYFTSVSTVIGGIVFTSQPFQGVAYAKSYWLTVTQLVAFPGLSVIVDPTGLAAGTYEGTITIWSVQVPVKLIVWDGPVPAITVTPSALLLSAPIGGSVTKTLRFATGEIPVPWAISVATTDGPAGWLTVTASSCASIPCTEGFVTPATVDITASARTFSASGTYHGIVTISVPVGPSNLVTIPVTLIVTAAQGQAPQPGPPLATFLLNGASALAGAIAPGEIIMILGQNIGPPDPVGSAIDPIGEAPTNLAGARVLFDGIAAPLLYASATQVNAIVPYEVATTGSTAVEVEYNGVRVPAGGFVLTPAAPAIFTLDSTGQGPAKARNADYSVNSAQNPAARGSVVHVYGTGEGVTSPLGVTGDASSGKRPVLPVKVTIGSADAVVQDAVSLAGTMPWVLQVNALVPQTIAPGDSVPIVLTIGGARSQDRVTIAVK
jgi:uncharacterized protein (TIGR03437 family)